MIFYVFAFGLEENNKGGNSLGYSSQPKKEIQSIIMEFPRYKVYPFVGIYSNIGRGVNQYQTYPNNLNKLFNDPFSTFINNNTFIHNNTHDIDILSGNLIKSKPWETFLSIFTGKCLLQTPIYYNVLRHQPGGDTNPLIFIGTNMKATPIPSASYNSQALHHPTTIEFVQKYCVLSFYQSKMISRPCSTHPPLNYITLFNPIVKLELPSTKLSSI